MNPAYFVRFSNGEQIEVTTSVPVSYRGLSPAQSVQANDDARFIFENVLRLIMVSQPVALASVQGETAQIAQVEPTWLASRGLKNFDPISAVMEERSLGRDFAQSYEFNSIYDHDPRLERSAVRDIRWKTSRTFKVLRYLHTAIVQSTIEAARQFYTTTKGMGRIQEFGFQIAFRSEIQIGAGKVNITKNYPVLLSIGYNRERRALSFRRSIRSEKMAGGVAMNVAGKVEFRLYALNARTVEATAERIANNKLNRSGGKPEVGFKGQVWYPPSIPILSPVFDAAPGYASVGFSIGANLADFVPGTYLLNTVSEFEDRQRVYTAEIPDAPKWFKDFSERLNESAAVFGGSGRGARCEALFKPSLVH